MLHFPHLCDVPPLLEFQHSVGVDRIEREQVQMSTASDGRVDGGAEVGADSSSSGTEARKMLKAHSSFQPTS